MKLKTLKGLSKKVKIVLSIIGLVVIGVGGWFTVGVGATIFMLFASGCVLYHICKSE